MFAVKVILLSDNNTFTPAIHAHQDDCKKQNGCCSGWENQRCDHLATTNLAEGRNRAKSLARRIGVYADC